MWKAVALSALALSVAAGSMVGSAAAQAPTSISASPHPRAGKSSPTATRGKAAGPRKHKARRAAPHSRHRHVASSRCFAHEWRAFPTRDPDGYFYTPPGGGIC